MRIAVNTRFLLQGRLEGLGRYTHEVLRHMVQAHPEHEFHFFFDRPFAPEFVLGPNVVPHVLWPQARHPLLYYLFFEHAVPRMLRKVKADVFFSPDGYLSLNTRRTPQVPVMHDLAFMHYPQYVGPAHRWHYRRYFPRYARRAAHILTVSEYTRQDVVRTFGIAPEKITVCHNGASDTFCPLPEAAREAVRAQYSQGQPYFLYVGSIHPRKNLENLLRAFEQFKEQTGHSARLLLTGRKAWDFDNVIQYYGQMRHKDAVQFTGFVSDEELNRLLNGSLALCYVSLFEGFGLPILEALQAEAPVICSDTSSMPEVAGPAALLVPPTQPQAIAAALARVLDPTVAQQLVAAGRQRRQQFSWSRTADICYFALEKAAVR